MNYLNRAVEFLLQHKQLSALVVFLISLACSVVYSFGPPGDPY